MPKKKKHDPALLVGLSAIFILMLMCIVLTVVIGLSQSPAPRHGAISKDHSQMIIRHFATFPEIKGAGIKQDGHRFELKLILATDIPYPKAQEHADNMVRQVKSFAPNEAGPRKRIGTGIYDYTITVYDRAGRVVLLGRKSPSSADLRVE